MSLDLLRTNSVPSSYQVRCLQGLQECAFSIFLVGEIFFPSWRSCFLWLKVMWVYLSIWGGEENLRGIRGQRPHGRKRPPHARWGLAPQILQPLAEVVHRKQVAHHDNQLQEPSSILHRCVIAFLLLPECVKEIGDAEE